MKREPFHSFPLDTIYAFSLLLTLTVLHGETEVEHLKRVQCFCPSAYVMRLFTRKGALLQPSQADAPLPACFVCGGSEITLQVLMKLFSCDIFLLYVIKWNFDKILL